MKNRYSCHWRRIFSIVADGTPWMLSYSPRQTCTSTSICFFSQYFRYRFISQWRTNVLLTITVFPLLSHLRVCWKHHSCASASFVPSKWYSPISFSKYMSASKCFALSCLDNFLASVVLPEPGKPRIRRSFALDIMGWFQWKTSKLYAIFIEKKAKATTRFCHSRNPAPICVNNRDAPLIFVPSCRI